MIRTIVSKTFFSGSKLQNYYETKRNPIKCYVLTNTFFSVRMGSCISFLLSIAGHRVHKCNLIFSLSLQLGAGGGSRGGSIIFKWTWGFAFGSDVTSLNYGEVKKLEIWKSSYIGSWYFMSHFHQIIPQFPNTDVHV